MREHHKSAPWRLEHQKGICIKTWRRKYLFLLFYSGVIQHLRLLPNPILHNHQAQKRTCENHHSHRENQQEISRVQSNFLFPKQFTEGQLLLPKEKLLVQTKKKKKKKEKNQSSWNPPRLRANPSEHKPKQQNHSFKPRRRSKIKQDQNFLFSKGSILKLWSQNSIPLWREA